MGEEENMVNQTMETEDGVTKETKKIRENFHVFGLATLLYAAVTEGKASLYFNRSIFPTGNIS